MGPYQLRGNWGYFSPSQSIIFKKKAIVKKIHLKPLKNLDPSADYEEQAQIKLEEGVLAIQKSTPIQSKLEDLYQYVENLSYKKHESLFQSLKRLIESHVKNLSSQFRELKNYYKALDDLWRSHCEQTALIRCVFIYMDSKYLKNKIWDISLGLFKTYIPLNYYNIKADMLALIVLERQGGIVDRFLLKSMIGMLIRLDEYASFEIEFLNESDRHYNAESQRLIEEMTMSEYLKHVERRLHEEVDRGINYLHKNTTLPLVKIIEKHFILDQLAIILEKGLEYLAENYQISDWTSLHSLMSRVENGLVKLSSSFSNYILKRGNIIVNGSINDEKLVQELLDFKDKIENIITKCFGTSQRVIKTLQICFENFINQRSEKVAELIALFFDSKLRSKVCETADLFDLVGVLRYVRGIDVFEAFYRKALAKRLIYGKSALENEKCAISQLKREFGILFTSKIEAMCKDIELSKDLNDRFIQFTSNQEQLGGFVMKVNILGAGRWPMQTSPPVNLPTCLSRFQKEFLDFYASQHLYRKLQWQSALGSCVVKAAFPRGEKELNLSLYQTLVLLLFNENDELTFEEIQMMTNFSETHLKRILQSLSCGKARVLRKTIQEKDVQFEDKFVYNEKFTSKRCCITINQVQMKETPEERERIEQQVFQERRFLIDAAIVRIMKMRKSLSHNLLAVELFQQLNFPVQPSNINERIERLIDKEYLERQKDDRNVYNYLA